MKIADFIRSDQGGTYMRYALPGNLLDIKRNLNDSLLRNAFFITLNSLAGAGIGFLFWMVAARMYTKADIGIATAMLATIALINILTKFGLDHSLMRFFPEGNKGKILCTCLVLTSLFSLIFGVVFIAGVDIWSPELYLVKDYSFVFLVALIASSMTSFLGASFVALRKSEYAFIQSFFGGTRILLLFPLVIFGALGIFWSFALTTLITLLLSGWILLRMGVIPLGMDRGFIRDSFSYSTGTYISGMLTTVPNQILPLIILNLLGAEDAAQFAIVFAIASAFLLIPNAVTTSLFVEGSHGHSLRSNTIKSMIVIFLALVPIGLFIILFGDQILGLIGENYVEGVALLQLYIIASFLVTFRHVYFSIKKVQKDIRGLISIGALTFALQIGLSFPFLLHYGLIGAGYAQLLCFACVSVVIFVLMRKEGWFKR
jgi:O-antigen/teichoic acid export membrane protein